MYWFLCPPPAEGQFGRKTPRYGRDWELHSRLHLCTRFLGYFYVSGLSQSDRFIHTRMVPSLLFVLELRIDVQVAPIDLCGPAFRLHVEGTAAIGSALAVWSTIAWANGRALAPLTGTRVNTELLWSWVSLCLWSLVMQRWNRQRVQSWWWEKGQNIQETWARKRNQPELPSATWYNATTPTSSTRNANPVTQMQGMDPAIRSPAAPLDDTGTIATRSPPFLLTAVGQSRLQSLHEWSGVEGTDTVLVAHPGEWTRRVSNAADSRLTRSAVQLPWFVGRRSIRKMKGRGAFGERWRFQMTIRNGHQRLVSMW